jgi:hypothetical protein
MSLEDKIINPMAPAELPGQRSEPLPKAGKKRRKGGGTAGAASAKPKKSDLDDEVGGDSTAVLTLGPSDDEPRRPQKKMLFESASDGATLAFTGPAIRRETPRPAPVAPPAPVMPTAKVKEAAVEAKVAPLPVPEVEKIAPAASIEAKPAPKAQAAPAPKSEPKDAATKAPVFEVAALAMREPEPQPEPEETPEAQPELPLTLEPAADDVAVSSADATPIAEAKIEESFDESLTLAFDATLADGLAERTAAAQEEIASEPETPAPAASFVPEPVALEASEAPPAIETVVQAEPEPAFVAIEPTPAPVYVAPTVAVAETPKVEPKPESETPSRGLSRSEAIAARLSARATPRPMPTAAETLAAARTAQQQMRSADLPKNPGDIYGYWTRVKNGRRFPSRADFDAEQVAEHWPNSMLLTCGSGIGAGSHGNFSSVLRLGANRRNRPGEDLNFTSMITEWILTTGGEAARAGTPVQDTEVFPTPEGTHAYKIVALPLSENQTRVDHVLCHLSRS